jgi:hypothetical protein
LQLSQDLGYVMYSAFGSFYIPSCIMVFVYIKIYYAAKARARRNIKKRKSRRKSNRLAVQAAAKEKKSAAKSAGPVAKTTPTPKATKLLALTPPPAAAAATAAKKQARISGTLSRWTFVGLGDFFLSLNFYFRCVVCKAKFNKHGRFLF